MKKKKKNNIRNDNVVPKFSPKFNVPAPWNNLSRHNIWNDIVVPKLKKQKKKKNTYSLWYDNVDPKGLKKIVYRWDDNVVPLGSIINKPSRPLDLFISFLSQKKTHTRIHLVRSSSSILHQHNQINTTFDTTITSKHQLHTHHCAQFV